MERRQFLRESPALGTVYWMMRPGHYQPKQAKILIGAPLPERFQSKGRCWSVHSPTSRILHLKKLSGFLALVGHCVEPRQNWGDEKMGRVPRPLECGERNACRCTLQRSLHDNPCMTKNGDTPGASMKASGRDNIGTGPL